MKDFKVFVEHAELVAEWSKTLEEMQEKAGKRKKQSKRDAKPKEKIHPRLKPDVLTPDAAGLRVKDDEGDEYTIADVEPPHVSLEDPEGNPVDTTIAGMSKFRLD